MLESKDVCESPYEEEEEEWGVMDVDFPPLDWTTLQVPASSCDDDAVATGVNAKVDKLLPVANKEEYLEQESEDEDASTTSSAETDYTEEKYPRENAYGYDEDNEEYPSEDEDEDNEIEVIEMEEYKSVPSEDEDNEKYTSEDEDDYNDVELIEPIPPVVTADKRMIPKSIDEESGSSQSAGEQKPSKNKWVASWKEVDPRMHETWINVYAYFRKEEGVGGYGVILRYADAKPVTASAKCTKDGKSFFYQVLTGIKVGVELAKKHQLSGRYVRCNSIEADGIISQSYYCRNAICRGSYDEKKICRQCKSCLDWFVGWDIGLWPLIQALKALVGLHIVKDPKNVNKAARYLAEMAKPKHGVEKKEKRIAGDDKDEDLGEIEPDKFPSELKDILWKDSTRGMSYDSFAPNLPW